MDKLSSNQSREPVAAIKYKERFFPLYNGLNTIGRKRDAQVPIIDASISHNHAFIIIPDKNTFYICDFQSTNGTKLNGITITPLLLHAIRDDTKILLANSVELFLTKNFVDLPAAEKHAGNDNGQIGCTFSQRTLLEMDTQAIPIYADQNSEISISEDRKLNESELEVTFNKMPFHEAPTQLLIGNEIQSTSTNFHEMETQLFSDNAIQRKTTRNSEESTGSKTNFNNTLFHELETQIMVPQVFLNKFEKDKDEQFDKIENRILSNNEQNETFALNQKQENNDSLLRTSVMTGSSDSLDEFDESALIIAHNYSRPSKVLVSETVIGDSFDENSSDTTPSPESLDLLAAEPLPTNPEPHTKTKNLKRHKTKAIASYSESDSDASIKHRQHLPKKSCIMSSSQESISNEETKEFPVIEDDSSGSETDIDDDRKEKTERANNSDIIPATQDAFGDDLEFNFETQDLVNAAAKERSQNIQIEKSLQQSDILENSLHLLLTESVDPDEPNSIKLADKFDDSGSETDLDEEPSSKYDDDGKKLKENELEKCKKTEGNCKNEDSNSSKQNILNTTTQRISCLDKDDENFEDEININKDSLQNNSPLNKEVRKDVFDCTTQVILNSNKEIENDKEEQDVFKIPVQNVSGTSETEDLFNCATQKVLDCSDKTKENDVEEQKEYNKNCSKEKGSVTHENDDIFECATQIVSNTDKENDEKEQGVFKMPMQIVSRTSETEDIFNCATQKVLECNDKTEEKEECKKVSVICGNDDIFNCITQRVLDCNDKTEENDVEEQEECNKNSSKEESFVIHENDDIFNYATQIISNADKENDKMEQVVFKIPMHTVSSTKETEDIFSCATQMVKSPIGGLENHQINEEILNCATQKNASAISTESVKSSNGLSDKIMENRGNEDIFNKATQHLDDVRNTNENMNVSGVETQEIEQILAVDKEPTKVCITSSKLPAIIEKDSVESQLEVMFATQTVNEDNFSVKRPGNPMADTFSLLNTETQNYEECTLKLSGSALPINNAETEDLAEVLKGEEEMGTKLLECDQEESKYCALVEENRKIKDKFKKCIKANAKSNKIVTITLQEAQKSDSNKTEADSTETYDPLQNDLISSGSKGNKSNESTSNGNCEIDVKQVDSTELSSTEIIGKQNPINKRCKNSLSLKKEEVLKTRKSSRRCATSISSAVLETAKEPQKDIKIIPDELSSEEENLQKCTSLSPIINSEVEDMKHEQNVGKTRRKLVKGKNLNPKVLCSTPNRSDVPFTRNLRNKVLNSPDEHVIESELLENTSRSSIEEVEKATKSKQTRRTLPLRKEKINEQLGALTSVSTNPLNTIVIQINDESLQTHASGRATRKRCVSNSSQESDLTSVGPKKRLTKAKVTLAEQVPVQQRATRANKRSSVAPSMKTEMTSSDDQFKEDTSSSSIKSDKSTIVTKGKFVESKETSLTKNVPLKRKRNTVARNDDADLVKPEMSKLKIPKRVDTSSSTGTVESNSDDEFNMDRHSKSKLLESIPIENKSSRTALRKSKRSPSIASEVDSSLGSPRTKRLQKPKVVFTLYENPLQESVIKRLGGQMVDSIDSCTVLVTQQVKRTHKLLSAIGQVKPIVSPSWIDECKIANKFVDPWEYIIQDEEAERKWSFSMRESLQKASYSKLYDNYAFQLATSSGVDVLKGAIESCGGKCVTRAPPKSSSAMFIVISSADEKAKYSKILKQKNAPLVVAAEAIFLGVLQQKLLWDDYKLTL